MNRRYAAGVGVLVAVLLMLVIGTVVWRTFRSPAPMEQIVVGSSTSAVSTPIWVAEAEDMFRAQGLDAHVRRFELGKEALAKVLQGEVDVASVAVTPIILASFSRRDFVVIATISSVDNDEKIIARGDRGIRSVDDLRGRTVGVSKGTSSEYFLEVLLAHHAVPREALTIKDLKQSDMADALIRGEVDAVATFEPYALQLRQRFGNDAFVIQAPEVHRKTFHLVVRREFARQHKDALTRLLRAVLRANDFIREQPKEAQAIMARRSGMSAADLATVFPDFTFALSLRQSLLPLFEDEARWAIRRGLVPGKAVPNYLEFIYPDPLKAVNAEFVTIIQ